MTLPVLYFDGHPRVLACLPRREKSGLPRFGEHCDAGQVLPGRIEVDLPIRDQGRSSACGGFSFGYASTAMHYLRTAELVQLSSTYLYALVNGGVDQGSNLGDLLAALLAHGNAPADAWPSADLFRAQGPAGRADPLAARFRLAEGYEVHTAAEAVSAVSQRLPCVIGIVVGSNFASVDSDGVSPPARDALGGHALYVDEVYQSARWGLCLGGYNSWGPHFGRAGRYRIPVDAYLRQLVDAVTLRRLVPDPQADGPLAA